MPTRCARCGSLAGRGRDVQLPGDWVAYLERERGLTAPVGQLSMPLCRDCVSTVDDVRGSLDGEATEAAVADRDAFLDEIDLSLLVDRGT